MADDGTAGWKQCTVSEIVHPEKYSCVGGPFGSSLTRKDYVKRGVPVSRGNNLTIGGQRFIDSGFVFVSEEKAASLAQNTAKPGDLIFTQRGTIGQVGQIPRDSRYSIYVLSQNQMKLTPDPKQADTDYLYFYFISPLAQDLIQQNSIGSTIPGFNLGQLRAFPVPLPPLPIQKCIAHILGSLDDKIELNRRMNRTLEAMAQAIFKSWFVDFEPVRARCAAKADGATPAAIERAAMAAIAGRSIEEAIAQEGYFDDLTPSNRESLAQTATLFPDAFQDSELGEIPAGWSVEPAEAIATRLKAGKKFTKKNVLSEGRIPVFDQGGGLLLGFHDGEADVNASPERPRFIFGDHTCVTHISLNPFSVGPNVIPLEARVRDSYWTFFAIKDLQEFQEYRRHWMEFRIKDVCVPENAIATRFGGLLKGLYSQIESNAQQSRTLAQLRDILLPKLLSGELAVPKAEPQTEEVDV